MWRFMIVQHNDKRAVITGSSTHNERIERLWRDVFRCVGKLFYKLFFRLEDEAALDSLNETDVFCLHYVFLPFINKCLKDFVKCWNNHNLSSENNYTPYQLFLVERIQNVDSSSMQNVNHVPIPASLSVRYSHCAPKYLFTMSTAQSSFSTERKSTNLLLRPWLFHVQALCVFSWESCFYVCKLHVFILNIMILYT